MLGPIELIDDTGETVAIGSPSQRTVLAVLASARGGVVSSDALIDALWGDAPPSSALGSLRTYISRLRRLLGDALASEPSGYSLGLEADATTFEALLDTAADAASPSNVDALRQALDLWRGRPYMGLEDVTALQGEIRRLDELRESAREGLAVGLLDSGQSAAAVAELESLLSDAPLREGAWSTLARALTAEGRPGDALRAVNRAVGELAEAGLEPSPVLRAAEAAALEGAPAEALPRPTPQAGRRAPLRHVPMVGRDDDVAAITALLDTARAVTLVGPGGVGKTSLATLVAGHREGSHRQGVRFVELAAVRNPLAVPSTILDGLGLTRGDGDTTEVLARAGTLDVLVVLDNCEHLLDAVAPIVEQMLEGGADLRVLASSRERLGVAGEHAWSVSPLRIVGEDPPARQLFLDRARAAAPDLEITEADLRTVDRIVRRVDGLPLAIEMAASGLTTVGLEELADLLDERLDLLRSARRSGDARHRTLRAVIEWSEALLDDREREAWGAMSVFAAAAARDDISAVVDEATAVELAPRLAERSLLVVDRRRPLTRYGMLETIRPRAAEQLGERSAELHERHSRHFTARITELDADLLTPAEPEAVDTLDDLFPDIRQSIRWAFDHDLALAAQIVADLYRYAHHCLLDQPLQWAERLLPQLDGTEPAFAGVATAAADREIHVGDLSRAKELAELALADGSAIRDTLELLGDIASYEGRHDEAIGLSERLLAESIERGDRFGEAIGRTNMAIALAYGGDPELAGEYLIDIPGGGPSMQGWLAFARGEVLLSTSPEQAIDHLDRALTLADSVRNRFLGGVARVSLASLRAWTGDPGEAVDTFAEIVAHWRAQGARTQQLTTLRHLVILFGRLSAWEAAAELFGNVAPDEQRPSWGTEADRLDHVVEATAGVLGDDRHAELTAQGSARTIDEAADVALDALQALQALQ